MNNYSRRGFIKTTGLATATLAALPHVLGQEKGKTSIAFVGVAHIHTPGFINLVKTRSDLMVKAVWDHDQARAEKRALELNARKVTDVNEIWNDPDIKAVVICSETNRHLDLVLAAAKAGKHMFVEKPLGITAKDSLRMAEAIEKANLLFTTGYFMRTDPKHLFLKEEIAKGNLGKITRIRGSNCHSGSLGGWFDTEWRWMADPKIAGVGAFGDLGTHKLDIMLWLLGDIEEATAEIRSVTGRYGECDETGEGLMRFRNGVIGTLAAGWVDIEDPVQLLISGTEGHALIEGNLLYYKSQKVQGADGKDPYTKLPKAPRAPMHQFFDAVAGIPGMSLVSPREGALRVAVMEAMYKGCRERKWVRVKV